MKTVIRPETEMKDSGIEYVGAIPKDWDLVRLRAYFGERKNKNKDGNETNLLSLSYGRIIRKNIDKTDGLLPASFNTYNIVEKNDIIIRPTDLQNDKRSLRTGLVTEHGIITSAYIDLMPIGNVDSRFVHYLLHSYDILKVFYNMGSGVRQGLNYSEFSKLKVPMPLLSEQQAIADYLDKTCSKIDEIIAEAKASIDEYKELKQSVIFEAVTKGLDKNVEMKDSGSYWIGVIPLTWSVIKTKYVIKIENGSDPSTEGNTPVYGSGANSFKTCGEYKEGPTVLLGRKGATLHIPHYIEGRYWNVDTAFNTISIEEKINLKYFYYVACCFDYNRYISQTTLPGMTQTSYRNIYIPYPPMTVQNRIVLWLDNKIDELDSLIAEKQSLIADLEAYKKSLIYEVVTGKRKVV